MQPWRLNLRTANALDGRRRRGAALVYCLVMLTVLLGLASFAADYGLVTVVKSELQSAVDAASIAGTGGLSISPAEARARAKAIALSNRVNGRPLTLLDSDIELGTWNTTTNDFVVLTGANESTATALRVTGRLRLDRGSQVSLSFLPLISGLSSAQPTASSVGGASAGSTDVVLVQDVSTSFVEELPDAKSGDRALLDSLNTAGSRSNFGVVAFSGWGKTIASMKSVASNYASLSNSINSLAIAGSPGMPAATGTDIAAGIEEARVVFSNFASAATATRAIVIVSDGEPSSYWKGKHPWYSDAGLLTLARSDADSAWAAGIHIYVVFFNRTGSQTSANNLRSLIRGSGVFVQVTDPALLPSAIGNIARRLPGYLVK